MRFPFALLIVTTFVAGHASADPVVGPTPSVSKAPPAPPAFVPKAQITNVRRKTADDYVSGPFSYLVDVKNLTAAAMTTRLASDELGLGSVTPTGEGRGKGDDPNAVVLPPNGTVTVEWVTEIHDGCGTTSHMWSLENGTARPVFERTEPECTFTSTTDLAWARAPGKSALRNDKLFYENAKLVSLGCGNFRMSADVVNKGSVPAVGVSLVVKGVSPMDASTRLNPDVLPPGTAVPNVVVFDNVFWGKPGQYALDLVATGGPPIGHPGFTVEAKRTCKPKVTFPSRSN